MSMDFIGFTYNGKHSFRDLHIYRTSNGSRYNDNLNAALTDKTADVPGGDGQYYFGTTHKNKTFSVSYAFDNLTESGLRLLKQTFDGKDIHDLIFDEEPYKVWSAKVTGTAQIKHLCFEESEGQRVYKGEGSITFTCYYPYAHTPNQKTIIFSEQTKAFKANELIKCGLIVPPDKKVTFKNIQSELSYTYKICKNGVWEEPSENDTINGEDTKEFYRLIEEIKITVEIDTYISNFEISIDDEIYVYTSNECFEFKPTLTEESTYEQILDGRNINHYSIIDYPNKPEWAIASGLRLTPTQGENFGDIPAHFVYTITAATATTETTPETTPTEKAISIGNGTIIIKKEDASNLTWDSKTGIVAKNDGDKIIPIKYAGNSLATIPVGASSFVPEEGTLTYNYWYY